MYIFDTFFLPIYSNFFLLMPYAFKFILEHGQAFYLDRITVEARANFIRHQ